MSLHEAAKQDLQALLDGVGVPVTLGDECTTGALFVDEGEALDVEGGAFAGVDTQLLLKPGTLTGLAEGVTIQVGDPAVSYKVKAVYLLEEGTLQRAFLAKSQG